MKEETKQNILNSLVSGKSLTTVLSAKAKEFMFDWNKKYSQLFPMRIVA